MKWVEAAKEGQDYVLSAELKEKRDTYFPRDAGYRGVREV